MQNHALLLIDIQNGFNDSSWGIRNNNAFETNIPKILEYCRMQQLTIIHVKHNSFHPKSTLLPGQPGNDFMEIAKPLPGELIFEKTVNSAFIGTDLEKTLREKGIAKITIVGLTTDHCVSTTTRMAANLGFKCTILTDATATFPRRDYYGNILEAELVHRVALASLDNEFATALTTAEFMASV